MISNDKYESYARSIVDKFMNSVVKKWDVVEYFIFIDAKLMDLSLYFREIMEKIIKNVKYVGKYGYIEFCTYDFDISYSGGTPIEDNNIIGFTVSLFSCLKNEYELFTSIVDEVENASDAVLDYINVRVGVQNINDHLIKALEINADIDIFDVTIDVGRRDDGLFFASIDAKIEGEEAVAIERECGGSSIEVEIDYENILSYLAEQREISTSEPVEKQRTVIDKHVTGLLKALDKLAELVPEKILDRKLGDKYYDIWSILLYMVV